MIKLDNIWQSVDYYFKKYDIYFVAPTGVFKLNVETCNIHDVSPRKFTFREYSSQAHFVNRPQGYNSIAKLIEATERVMNHTKADYQIFTLRLDEEKLNEDALILKLKLLNNL